MRKVLSFVFLLITINQAFAQVEVPFFGKIKYLKGYAKEIAGENIYYTSALPDVAKIALLTRCTDGEMKISWETEPIPLKTDGDFIYFAMVAAYAQGTLHGNRNFDFHVNDKNIFNIQTFQNNKDSVWHYESIGGEALVFKRTRQDANYDNHGFLFLRLPVSEYVPGKPVRISMVGKNENSPDWFMVFKYNLKEDVSVLPFSLITKDNMQPIAIRVVHFGENATMTINIKKKTYHFNLFSGKNEFLITEEPVKHDEEIDIRASIKNGLDTSFSIILKPVVPRDIYLIHHSHYDVGYSDLQPKVEIRHNQNILNALRYIERTKHHPFESRFRWNIETSNAVDNFSKVCTSEQWIQLINCIKEGSISIGANYANISTGICSPDELFKITSYSNQLMNETGISIQTAMMGDIPGLVWSSLPAMARTGVKYFSDGPNYGGSYPYEGDRIGWSSVNWKDQPFYWVSPSGKEKILFWLAGKGYSSWHGSKPGDIFSTGPKKISDYMNELQDKNYPYNMVQWRYNIVADNGPTDSLIADFVKKWNEDYISPKIVLSTVDYMFQVFEKKYGSQLPEYSGDFTPYWEDGCYSTLSEMVINNRNTAALTNLATLYSIVNPKLYSQEQFDEAWKNIILWDEHTWGAFNSVSDPDLTFVTEQWKYKKNYALRADSLIRALEKHIFSNNEDITRADVYNTSSWERSEIVYLQPSQSIQVNSITDLQGKEMQMQKLLDGRIAFLAENIPAFGAKQFLLKSAKSKLREFKAITDVAGSFINKNYIIEFNQTTGSIASLKLLPDSLELVDKSKHTGLNEYLYVAGLNPQNAKANTNAKIKVKDSGPLFTTFIIESDAPGCKSLKSEITFFENESRIDISNTIDKISTRDKESVHIAFPFFIPLAQNRFNTGWNGIFSPGNNQLKGSNQDYYCVQNWLDISDSKVGVTMLLMDANLIEQGEMLSEEKGKYGVKDWKKEPSVGTTIYSYVLNNYWHTNFKADQEGITTVRYSLIPHRKFDMLQTQRAGIGYTSPLIVTPAADKNPPLSLFQLSEPDIIATSVEPSGGNLFIRMFNVSNKDIECKILWNGIRPEKMKVTYGLNNVQILDAKQSMKFPAQGIVELETLE